MRLTNQTQSPIFVRLSSSPRLTLVLVCTGEDFWRWQTMNPCGYRDASASPDTPVKSKAAVNGTAEHSVNGSVEHIVNGSAQPTAFNGSHQTNNFGLLNQIKQSIQPKLISNFITKNFFFLHSIDLSTSTARQVFCRRCVTRGMGEGTNCLACNAPLPCIFDQTLSNHSWFRETIFWINIFSIDYFFVYSDRTVICRQPLLLFVKYTSSGYGNCLFYKI